MFPRTPNSRLRWLGLLVVNLGVTASVVLVAFPLFASGDQNLPDMIAAQQLASVGLVLLLVLLLFSGYLVFRQLQVSTRALQDIQESYSRHISEQELIYPLDTRLRDDHERRLQEAAILHGRSRGGSELASPDQITEGFTRAIDQLGSNALALRLGGIYALERIARDSAGHRAAAAEVLSAYIREHAPWPPFRPGQYVAEAPSDEVPTLLARARDIQVALTVVGRKSFTTALFTGLDLNRTDLRRAQMAGASLRDVDLHDADLRGADLRGADLRSADLHDADLRGANLREADLSSADLHDADLRGANLREADLSSADLHDADLREADLSSADLHDADLRGADLREANLGETNLVGARIISAVSDHVTQWPGGFDWKAAGVSRAEISVFVFLDTEDKVTIGNVTGCVDQLADALGYEGPIDVETRDGSFIRRSRAWLQRIVSSREVSDRLVKVERALELAMLEARQVQVDDQAAGAFVKVLDALKDVDRAVIRVGSIFVVKFTTTQGPAIAARSLSQVEIRALERYPEIQQNPETALGALSTACDSLRGMDQESGRS